jgi:predicted TIM-barrel fold metal-dependent hydrolase
MVDWRTIKKIDAHIHILPDDVHEANLDSEDAWVHAADLHKYCGMMDESGVEKAVIMPFNDPWLMSMEFTIDAVHKNLYEMKQRYPGKFYPFADIDTRNTSTESAEAIHKAIVEYGLDGIKIHPNNTGIDLDSAYNQAIFAYAQENNIPVAIHSYPNSEDDRGAAYRIINILEQYPELTVIISHMGAHQWEQLLPTHAYVDISAILPDYVRTYGIAKTNEILRSFGADRLIFATDYPDSRILEPDEIYGSYFDILNQMDFTIEEVEKIAYGNISEILKNKGVNHD